jgi:hypothetical protein
MCLHDLLQTCPSGANRLGVVVSSAFVNQALSNILFLISGLFHPDNELVIGIHLCRNFLRESRASS